MSLISVPDHHNWSTYQLPLYVRLIAHWQIRLALSLCNDVCFVLKRFFFFFSALKEKC